MIKLQLDLSAITPLNRIQIEHLAELASGFSSRIIFDYKSRVINGKSMLGLLSLGVTGDTPVSLICEGEDEEEAAREIKNMLDGGIAPPKTAADAMALMQKIKAVTADVLGENLAGIYLHGSLAAGCFRWEISDVDFLVVVHAPLTLEKKVAYLNALHGLTREMPPKGIEMSVILEKHCRAIPYPIPFELHYSNAYRAEFEGDPEAFCRRMHGEDPDLTTHILSLHSYGQVIFGRSISRMFDKVSREDAIEAICLDVGDAAEKLHDDPRYYVLTLCRALAYVRDGKVLSKKEGGEWALRHLSLAHQRVIQAALNAYESGIDMSYDRVLAEEFCDDALAELGV